LFSVSANLARLPRTADTDLGGVCPGCHGSLIERSDGWFCAACCHVFPEVAGLPDFRLASDRYLSLEQDRAKAERLAESEHHTDLIGLSKLYYELTADVDARRRARYISHGQRAHDRGRAMTQMLPQKGRILEIGCGSGGLLTASAETGRAVIGVDIAMRWLVIARRRLRDHALPAQLLGASAERLPWADDTFDAVAADSVLEHLEDPALALKEWKRVLRPSGRLIVWSPNRLALAPDPHVGLWGVGWLPPAWASAYVRLRLACEWTVRPFSAGEAHRLAVAAGFTDVRIEPARIFNRDSAFGSPAQNVALRLYGSMTRWRAGRAFLLAFGPLWQLSARKDGSA
jgi:SAM-dependent methyltransferase